METATDVEIYKEYGCVHLKNALTNSEQKALFDEVRGQVRGVGDYPGTFHASSGPPGSKHRNDTLHTLGELLFSRCAEAVVSSLTPEEITAEQSLTRLAAAASGETPPSVNNVTGASYKPGATMVNHSDLDRPLYTMSVAVGDSCDFTIGKATARPKKNERSGKPVTIRMGSGDAVYFDGGGVPHEVTGIVAGTAPGFFDRPNGVARIGVLFREDC